jgi:YD repeat-containing protein
LHQLVARTYQTTPSRSENFTFDRAGRMLTATNDHSEVTMTYDAVGRLATALQTYDPGTANEVTYTTTYGYVVDPVNHLLQRSVTYPGLRQVTATMDARSRLESVYDGLNIGVEWEFDAGNRRQYAHLSNGVESIFSYDLNNRLTQIQHASEVNQQLVPFYDIEQGYDAVGNRLWKRDNIETDRSETYAYDQRHRLIGFERGTMDPVDPVIATPSADLDMPNQQDWLNLDARGNWLGFGSQIDTSLASQTRTLSDVGGPMNEYDRIDLTVGVKRPFSSSRMTTPVTSHAPISSAT